MSTKVNDNSYDVHMQQYMDAIKKSYIETSGSKDTDHFSVEIESGSLYDKVVVCMYGNHSSHSYVCRRDTGKFVYGDILKSASWKTPAKNKSRGNIFTPASYSHVRWSGIS